jgi:putative ABC transport system permease protein
VPLPRLPWREVAEGLVVLAAVGAVLLVRRRGVGGVADSGVDPVVALTPLLVALAAGVVALRGYQWLTGPVVHWVGRRRGAVGFVALASAGRRTGVVSAVVLVLLAGTALSLFASAITSTIRDGQTEAAYLEVGADYRLDAPAFTDEQAEQLASLDGIDTVAPAFVRTDVAVAGGDDTIGDVTFVAVDTATYDRVAAAAAPPEQRLPVEDLEGSAADGADLRVLVTPGLVDAGDEPVLALGSGIGDVRGSVVGTVDEVPLAGGEQAVVADLAALQESEGGLLRATTLLAEGDAGAGPGIEQAVASWGMDVAVSDRRAWLAQTRTLPFVDSTVAMFRLGFVAVAAYGVAAFVMFLLLTAETRARMLATLRRLGMPRRQAGAVSGLELVPVVSVALVAGVAAGVGLTRLLVPAVELTPFTGGSAPPDPVMSPWVVAALVLGVVAVVATATYGVSVAAGRRRGEDLMRTGADE